MCVNHICIIGCSIFFLLLQKCLMIIMAASKYGMFSDPILMGMTNSSSTADVQQNSSWGTKNGDDNDNNMCGESSESTTISSSFDNSINSDASSSSLELVEDASSSSSNNSSLVSSPQLNKGPLYELSELMAQLPIKRGLSMHFQGKSQSFTSFSQVRSMEDLVKRENPYKKKMKSCKSYGGLDGNNNNKSFAPKACIAKKVSRGSFLSSLGKKNYSLNNSPRSPLSLEKNF